MKLLKAAVAGAFLIIAAAGVQAKEAEPVRTVKYSAYTEEQYGLDMTLKPNGKVIRDHHSLDIEGKKKSEICKILGITKPTLNKWENSMKS